MDLSDPAKLARTSLAENPELKTPKAIDNGPWGIEQINVQQIANGLAELEAAGLAVQKADGWHLVKQADD